MHGGIPYLRDSEFGDYVTRLFWLIPSDKNLRTAQLLLVSKRRDNAWVQWCDCLHSTWLFCSSLLAFSTHCLLSATSLYFLFFPFLSFPFLLFLFLLHLVTYSGTTIGSNVSVIALVIANGSHSSTIILSFSYIPRFLHFILSLN